MEPVSHMCALAVGTAAEVTIITCTVWWKDS